MLEFIWMSSNMADGNLQKHLLPSFAVQKREFTPRTIDVFPYLLYISFYFIIIITIFFCCCCFFSS